MVRRGMAMRHPPVRIPRPDPPTLKASAVWILSLLLALTAIAGCCIVSMVLLVR